MPGCALWKLHETTLSALHCKQSFPNIFFVSLASFCNYQGPTCNLLWLGFFFFFKFSFKLLKPSWILQPALPWWGYFSHSIAFIASLLYQRQRMCIVFGGLMHQGVWGFSSASVVRWWGSYVHHSPIFCNLEYSRPFFLAVWCRLARLFGRHSVRH